MARFWQIKNEVDADIAEIMLYKPIADEAWWDDATTPKDFADDLKALNGKNVVVRINCRGGDVFAAQAMYNQLKRYSGNVDVTIDGMAASAATIVACAGNTVTMPSNTTYMIHNPMNLLYGYYDEQELKETADALKIVKQTIVNVYKKKCKNKISEDKIVKMMDEETFLTADEAKEYGFIDVIDEENNVSGVLDKGNLIINSVEFDAKSFENPDKIMEIINKKRKKESKNMAETKKKSSFLYKLQEITNNLRGINANNGENDEIAEARKAERQRIKDLIALRAIDNELINNLIDEAIDDETVTADKISGYIDQIKAASIGDKAKNIIQDLIKDQQDSGATGIVAAPKNQNPVTDEQQSIDMLSQALKDTIDKKMGGKK